MYGIHYGTHRAIACIVLFKHNLLKAEEIVGLLDATPLQAVKLAEFYDAKQLVLYNTTVIGGQTIPWFTPSKVTNMLSKFELEKMFDPGRDQGLGIHLASNKGTKHLLQEARETDLKSDVTAASYINSISKIQLNRIS
jgi:hypothetical protein